MKYLNMILAVTLVAMSAYAAQDSALTIRQVRDPVQLRAKLNANALDAETRVAAIEGGTATVTLGANKLLVGNDTSNQTAMAVIGAVTVTQDGTSVTTVLTDESVTLAKMADIATLSVIGRSTAAAGVPEVLSAATDHFVLRRSAAALGFGLLLDANIDASAAIASTKLSGVAAAPTVVGSVATTTNTVTVTATDGAGATLAARRLIRVWVSEAAFGVPSTNNIESVTLSGGTAIQTVTAAADYVYLTADTGIASAEVVGTAAGTNYMNVADGGYVTSAAVVFE